MIDRQYNSCYYCRSYGQVILEKKQIGHSVHHMESGASITECMDAFWNEEKCFLLFKVMLVTYVHSYTRVHICFNSCMAFTSCLS